MKKQRRKFNAEFKLEVILEALKERITLSDLCQKYDLHPNQISKWKKDFIENAKDFLKPPRKAEKGEEELEKEKLFEKIGRLQMENDFLKKKFLP